MKNIVDRFYDITKEQTKMKKPTMLMILDGFGCNPSAYGNAIAAAHKPNIDKLFSTYPNTTLGAVSYTHLHRRPFWSFVSVLRVSISIPVSDYAPTHRLLSCPRQLYIRSSCVNRCRIIIIFFRSIYFTLKYKKNLRWQFAS